MAKNNISYGKKTIFLICKCMLHVNPRTLVKATGKQSVGKTSCE
jgi:hypothetical protein